MSDLNLLFQSDIEKSMFFNKRDKMREQERFVLMSFQNCSDRMFDEWVGDTGVTYHITNSRNGMYNVRK